MPDEGWKDKLLARHVAGKGLCVFARGSIASGQIIGWFEGEETSEATMHSVHLEGRNIHGTGVLRNLAHSCEPNAHFKDRRRWLLASTDIAAGTEVTIDYLHTEPVISEPFACKCGSSRCRGLVCTPGPNEAI